LFRPEFTPVYDVGIMRNGQVWNMSNFSHFFNG
jgi:hypothetical protein